MWLNQDKKIKIHFASSPSVSDEVDCFKVSAVDYFTCENFLFLTFLENLSKRQNVSLSFIPEQKKAS